MNNAKKDAVKHVHEWTGLQLDQMANITCSAVHKSYNGLHRRIQVQQHEHTEMHKSYNG